MLNDYITAGICGNVSMLVAGRDDRAVLHKYFCVFIDYRVNYEFESRVRRVDDNGDLSLTENSRIRDNVVGLADGQPLGRAVRDDGVIAVKLRELFHNTHTALGGGCDRVRPVYSVIGRGEAVCVKSVILLVADLVSVVDKGDTLACVNNNERCFHSVVPDDGFKALQVYNVLDRVVVVVKQKRYRVLRHFRLHFLSRRNEIGGKDLMLEGLSEVIAEFEIIVSVKRDLVIGSLIALVDKNGVGIYRVNAASAFLPEIKRNMLRDVATVAVNAEFLNEIFHIRIEVFAKRGRTEIDLREIPASACDVSVFVKKHEVGMLLNKYGFRPAMEINEIKKDLEPEVVGSIDEIAEVGVSSVFLVDLEIISHTVGIRRESLLALFVIGAPIDGVGIVVRVKAGAEINDVKAERGYMGEHFFGTLESSFGCKRAKAYLVEYRAFFQIIHNFFLSCLLTNWAYGFIIYLIILLINPKNSYKGLIFDTFGGKEVFFENTVAFRITDVLELRRKKKKGHHTVPRNISVLSYRLSGGAEFSCGGTKYSVTNGDVLFIPAYADYSQRTDGERVIAIHLDVLDADFKDFEIFQYPYIKGADAVFLEIFKIWTEREAGYRYRATAKLAELLSEIHSLMENNELHSGKLGGAFKYIKNNFTDPSLTVARVAAASNFSEVYFRRIFTSSFGKTPISYITELRIDYAKRLLRNGCYTVGEVAEKSGFNDVKYFSTCFKKHTSMTPRQYMNWTFE